MNLNDVQSDLCLRAWDAMTDAGLVATPRSLYDYMAMNYQGALPLTQEQVRAWLEQHHAFIDELRKDA